MRRLTDRRRGRPSVRSVCPSVLPSVRPSVRPSISPSVRPSVRPSISPSVRARRQLETKLILFVLSKNERPARAHYNVDGTVVENSSACLPRNGSQCSCGGGRGQREAPGNGCSNSGGRSGNCCSIGGDGGGGSGGGVITVYLFAADRCFRVVPNSCTRVWALHLSPPAQIRLQHPVNIYTYMHGRT